MISDGELLGRYAKDRDEAAFAEFVERYLGLVYSVALRQLMDAETAKDISQAVFMDVARRASLLSKNQVLGGWLYQHTRFLCSSARRTDERRKRREELASAGEERAESGMKLDGAIDEGIAELNEADRDALTLRLVEGRSYAEVAGVLGCTENAARMRVERATEKLREILGRKGITSSSGAITAVLGAMMVTAPKGMAATVTAASLAMTASTPLISTAVFTLMNAQLKLAVAGLALALATSTGVVLVRQNARIAELQSSQAALESKLEQMANEQAATANSLNAAQAVKALKAADGRILKIESARRVSRAAGAE